MNKYLWLRLKKYLKLSHLIATILQKFEFKKKGGGGLWKTIAPFEPYRMDKSKKP